MYQQREKEDKKKTTKAQNVIRKTALVHNAFTHRPNGLLQRQGKARSDFVTHPFLPELTTIQRMDDKDKDKDKNEDKTDHTSENLDNIQSGLELLSMIPSQAMTGTKLGAKAAASAVDVLAKTAGDLVDSDDIGAVGSGLKDAVGKTSKRQVGSVVPDNNSIRTPRDQALANVRNEADTLGVEIRTGQEANDYLDMSARMAGIPPEKMHAVTLGDDLIMVREAHVNDPRVLREELLHTQQQKPGFEVSNSSITNAEIEVREQMIRNRHEWGLTNDEVREMIQDIRTIRERGDY